MVQACDPLRVLLACLEAIAAIHTFELDATPLVLLLKGIESFVDCLSRWLGLRRKHG